MFCPQRIKLGFNHCAVDVQVVAFVDSGLSVVFNHLVLAEAGAHRVACKMPLIKPLANGCAVVRFQCSSECVDGCLQRAAVVVFLVRLAVAFKTASLVYLEQRPSKLGASQCRLQTPGAQLVRVKRFQRLAFIGLFRKEAVGNQRAHHARLALEQAVTAAAHGARITARDRQ